MRAIRLVHAIQRIYVGLRKFAIIRALLEFSFVFDSLLLRSGDVCEIWAESLLAG